jgi:bla regulator protein blaR1
VILRTAVRAEQGREMDILRRMETLTVRNARIALLLSQEMMEPGIFGIFCPVLIWPERLS